MTETSTTNAARASRLAGRYCRLRPLAFGDGNLLGELIVNGYSVGAPLRRAVAPNPQQAMAAIEADGYICQYVVVDALHQSDLGIVACRNPSLRDGWAFVEVTWDRSTPPYIFAEALVLFLGLVFDSWAFRRVYLEAPACDYSLVEGAERNLFAPHVRIPEHCFRYGRLWDLCVTFASRERFTEVSLQLGLEHVGLYNESVEIPGSDVMTLDAFLCWLRRFGNGIPEVRAQDHLQTDLGIDIFALGAIEIELLSLCAFPLVLQYAAPSTVRDLYLWYCTSANLPPRVSAKNQTEMMT